MKPEHVLEKIRSIYGWANEATTHSGLDILRDAVGAEHVILTRESRSGPDVRLACNRLAGDELNSLEPLWANDFADAPFNRIPSGKAFRVTDFLPLQAITESSRYQEIVRHIDGGLGASTKLTSQESSSVLFICRSARQGLDFSNQDLMTIDLLASHVIEANEIRIRMETSRNRESQGYGVLNLVDQAVVLLNQEGRIVFINHEAGALFSNCASLSCVNSRVRATNNATDITLQAAIRRASDHDFKRTLHPVFGSAALFRLSVPQERGLPLTVKVFSGSQLGGERYGLSVSAVLMITDPEKTSLFKAEQFSSQFGLSEREAQLAALVCSGARLKEAAAAMAISVGTARQYLKSVFVKTGVNRQSDLIRLVRI
ncbi:helix-turn-helix transcriptional regulator [Shinella sp. CPCC 101442]|uniref:helix-turn-helix transcriptional regulator n=1 Tax=Shinella sp. CPCC 101442 TaxID=2932265 RepID=UPI002152B461|nr:helix-turn-helix transcriptional regulator [Shinella sp. CPCC 101442]MCR6502821.1 helix-turn-helix transcriptional regulator [Shinella sp. CPCC 101442]